MLEPKNSNKFMKDYVRIVKRHKDINKLDEIMTKIILEEPLPEHCRPHILSSKFVGLWECHIEGDWILIYAMYPIKKTVYFSRTGTHSDLFK